MLALAGGGTSFIELNVREGKRMADVLVGAGHAAQPALTKSRRVISRIPKTRCTVFRAQPSATKAKV